VLIRSGVLICVGIAASCATTGGWTRADAAASPGQAILQVTNKSVDDLQLSLVRSGTTIRLGTIAALSTRVFLISDGQIGDGAELQLSAGTRSRPNWKHSGAFSASVGKRITWVIDAAVCSGSVIIR
jgi:hypothetical protein